MESTTHPASISPFVENCLLGYFICGFLQTGARNTDSDKFKSCLYTGILISAHTHTHTRVRVLGFRSPPSNPAILGTDRNLDTFENYPGGDCKWVKAQPKRKTQPSTLDPSLFSESVFDGGQVEESTFT